MVSNLQAWGVWIGLFILFSGIGYYVLHYILFKDYEIKKKLANFVFCGTFAFSLNTLSLILYEIFQVGDSDTILVMWAVNLSCLVFSLLFFIPFIAFFQGIQKVQMSQFWKVVLEILVLICYSLIILVMIDKQKFYYFQNEGGEASEYQLSLNFENLLQVGILIDFITYHGTYLIAIVSGFGVVYGPFCYFNFYYKNIKKLEEEQKVLKKNIDFLIQQVTALKYKAQILKRKYQVSQSQNKKKESFFSFQFFNPIKNIFKGFSYSKDSSFDSQIDYVHEELNIINEALKDYYQEYCDRGFQLLKYQYSKTLQGKFFKLLSFWFSVWCTYKIVMSTFNYLVGRKKSIDPINRILYIIFKVVGWDLNDQYYQIICGNMSFIFTGFLIFSNTRSFSLNIMNFLNLFTSFPRFFKFFQKTMSIYLISMLFGVYLLSNLVLMQSSIADIYLKNFTKICGNIDLIFHYYNFDLAFIVSALSSMVILYINIKIKERKLYNSSMNVEK